MTAHQEKFIGLASVHALGALDGAELKEFQEHLATQCSICRGEVNRLTRVASLLPIGLAQVHLAPELKERILFSARLAQVARATFEPREETEKVRVDVDNQETSTPTATATTKVRREGKRSWLAIGLTFAAIVMIVAFSAYVVSLFRTIQYQRDYIRKQEAHIARLVDGLDQKSLTLQFLQSRGIELFTLEGQNRTPDAYGKLLWDPERGMALLHVANLPSSAAGKEYYLWMMKGTSAIGAGGFTITPDRAGRSYFTIQPVDSVDKSEVSGFMITLESTGGAMQPSKDIYLLGTATIE